MYFSSQLFKDIVRNCGECDLPYDDRLHAPYMLSCSHTFCLMCFTKTDQRRRRCCFECDTKYTKMAPNLALIEVIKRIDERKKWLSCETKRCDECDNRVPLNLMRKCKTCESQFLSKTEFPMECVICIECCVNSHNGHLFNSCAPVSAPSSVSSSPMIHRTRKASGSSTISVRFRDKRESNKRLTPKGLINTIRSWSFRTSTNDVPFLLTPSSKFRFSQEDIVMESRSPFYDSPLNRRAISMNYNDNISLDSVFEGRSDSPQSTIMPSTRPPPPPSLFSVSKLSPTSIKSSNDSGIFNTPSPHQTKIFSQSSFNLTPTTASRSKKHRIRMGVSDIINSPRRAQIKEQVFHCSTPVLLTRSEDSIVTEETLNPSFNFIE